MNKFQLTAIFILATVFSNAAVLVLEGKYQNKNLYVQNGFASGGVGFCAKEIKVNGRITSDETNSTSFEIDLSALPLQYGDDVVIEIFHTNDCSPKVLNADDLRPLPTFEMLMMNISSNGLFTWRTEKETGPLPYIIEQFKWNKWVKVGEVQGIGSEGQHDYSFQLSMHSGENKYRVRQKGYQSIPKVSKTFTVRSNIGEPSFAMPKDKSKVDFSTETAYEIYDEYGEIVRKGFNKHINTKNLKKGNYYLCYDNTVTKFKK